MEKEGMFGRYMGEMEEENRDWYDYTSLYWYMKVSTKSIIYFFWTNRPCHLISFFSLWHLPDKKKNIKTRILGFTLSFNLNSHHGSFIEILVGLQVFSWSKLAVLFCLKLTLYLIWEHVLELYEMWRLDNHPSVHYWSIVSLISGSHWLTYWVLGQVYSERKKSCWFSDSLP